MFEISGIGLFTAFLAGLVSFLSPCVLPLVPAYLSYIAGQTVDDLQDSLQIDTRHSAILLSCFFVLGFSTVFITLGASASVLGQLLLSYRYEANIVGGAIVILFGLLLVGIVKIPWLMHDFHFKVDIKHGRPLAAYVLGLAFGFGWTPCIGPVLGAVLTLSAASTTIGGGISLLVVYSLGLAVPFLIAALFTGYFLRSMKTLRRLGRPLQIISGIIMIIMGIAMITGYLSTFAFWILQTFPVFGTIG
ncbi:MAG: cytochrome c biogenesis CcdA family protein [Gammaproteobacteria bacterium]|nr:MAG: cytochrome c biogenesis CcdA family protein [Gammaproteobacteria bacterium]